MASMTPARVNVDDLWRAAADGLTEEDKRRINFDNADKYRILTDLSSLTETARQECLKKRWKYTRKSGETVILRDVFDKIVKWIDIFKKVGDIAIQYDPVYAALPWAGIRFVLEIAVKDYKKFASVVEGISWVTELICRYAIVERLYTSSTSEATVELKRNLTRLYTCILIYLFKAKYYLEQGSAKRFAYSIVSVEAELDPSLENIRTAQCGIRDCTSLVDRHDQIQHHAELSRLLSDMNSPLKRMNDDLRSIQDGLQRCKRTKILQWISPQPYIQHHEQAKTDVISGTGQWLLSDPVFKKWKDESASSILWLHGIPGSGKSKLVSIVIEDVLSGFPTGNNPGPVFFYSSRNPAEPGRSDPGEILASLARQLSCLEPGKPLLKPTVDLYNKKETEGFASGSLRIEESCSLIIKLAEEYPLTTIVIDALDECKPGKRRDLVKALENVLQKSSGLVKIFVSSRNDQDIIWRLQRYPNLEIESKRNSDDIALFVKEKTEQLIDEGELLQYSESPAEMKDLIVETVIGGAAGMFRWASMQLQHLCSFNMDEDIRENIGRLPSDLNALYAEIYDAQISKPGKFEVAVFKNMLSWLLCAQRMLKSTEFLAAVSINPQRHKDPVAVTKDQVLKICSNFVVFDNTLDTFRLAHLSVREFLEARQEYTSAATNALVAEICLWDLISMSPNQTATKCLCGDNPKLAAKSSIHDKIGRYSVIYWATHCQLAADERASGRLKSIFWLFMTGGEGPSCPIGMWNAELLPFLDDFSTSFDLLSRLRSTLLTSTMYSSVAAAWFLAAAFDFPEVLQYQGNGNITLQDVSNRQGQNLLHVSVAQGSFQSLKMLLNELQDEIKITEKVIEVVVRNGSKDMMALLLEQYTDKIEITENILKAAAGNWNSGEAIMTLLFEQRGDEIKISEKLIEEAAGNGSIKIMTVLLNHRGDQVKVTENVLDTAARNGSKRMMTLLLKHCTDEIKITEKTLKAAARNGGKGMMTLLLEQYADKIKITGNLLETATRNWSKDMMALLLEQRGDDIKITEEILEAAAENQDSGKDLIALLLKQRGDDIKITEKILEAATRNRNKEIMALILEQRGDEIVITEKILEAAAGNWNKEIMALLLEQRGDEIKITEKILEAAAGNHEKEVIILLLEQCGDEIMITEKILEAAAGNWNKEIMALLLEQRGDDIKITEKILEAATRNRNKEIMALILEQCGDEIVITEKILEAAAGNWNKEIMALLLEQRGDDIKITEKILEAATRNRNKEIMALILEQCGDEIVITEKILEAAAGNWNKEIMALLLEQRGDEIKITEKILEAAAGNHEKEVIILLLEQCGDEIMITEKILEAAAGNWNKDIMALLLEQRGDEIKITEKILEAAAGNHEKEVIILLLEQCGDEIMITEKILEAAAGNWNKEIMALLLEQRGDEIVITEKILEAAARNRHSGKDIIVFLLEQRGNEIKITEKVLEAAARNRDSGKDIIVFLLEQRGNEIKITEKVLKAAARNRDSGKDIIVFLLEQRGR